MFQINFCIFHFNIYNVLGGFIITEIKCAICKKIIKEGEYVWFDDNLDEYYDYNCVSHLNNVHNLVYGKLDLEGNFKIIPMVAYGAGPVSNEWHILDLEDILKDSKFCSHGKKDLFNHIPIFKQNNTIFCSKCYEKIDNKEGECFVLLEDNKVRWLYPYLYESSNVNFSISCEKFNEDFFNLKIYIKNLKRSKLSYLNISLFSFDSSLDLNDEDIGWMLESPINEVNLIIFENYNIEYINSKDSFEKEIAVRIPKKNEIKTFDLALKNNLINEDTLKLNDYFGIEKNESLNIDFPLDIYIIVSFKNHYGVYQSYEQKIVLDDKRIWAKII